MRSKTMQCLVLLAGAATILTGCNSDDEDQATPVRNCRTEVGADATSPAPGALTLQGKFYSDETVILRYTLDNTTRSALGTPASDRTSFTLTGLPPGPTKYQIVISCNDGQDNFGSDVFTVQ